MMVRRVVLLLGLWYWSAGGLAQAQFGLPPDAGERVEAAAHVLMSLPRSVLLYESLKDRLPVHTVDGVPLQGLNLCRVLERDCDGNLFPLDARDFSPDELPCDLSHVLVAYAGWCEAGVLHEKDPHLAPSQAPWARCRVYGTLRVVWLTNGRKVLTPITAVGELKAVEWLTRVAEGLEVEPWSPDVPLLPAAWKDDWPPHPVRR